MCVKLLDASVLFCQFEGRKCLKDYDRKRATSSLMPSTLYIISKISSYLHVSETVIIVVFVDVIFVRKYAPRCSVCRQAILPDNTGVETVRVVALDRNFHVQCYKCEVSSVDLS